MSLFGNCCVQLKGEVEELKDVLVERDGQLTALQVRRL